MRSSLCSTRQASNQTDTKPRSWARRRISPLFHGESIVTDCQRRSAMDSRKHSWNSHLSSHARDENYQSGLRSPTSTRSLIDPSSTLSSNRSISPERFEIDPYRPATAHVRPRRVCFGMGRAERHLARALRPPCRSAWLKSRRDRPKRTCLPRIRDPKLRRKTIGCLISGAVLAVALSIYLALAVSNSISGQAWHAVFIIFILVVTILFCHYLIRLCMLVLSARRHGREVSNMTEIDEDGFAPQEPIRVILARDEDLGLHENYDEESNVLLIAQPPPAYGLWRCSVRANPNLIHWRRADEQEVRDKTSASALAEHSTNRPPSYV